MEESPTIEVVTCKQCGHSWEPRVPNPRSCPACKSYVWSRAASGKVVREVKPCTHVPDVDTSGKP